MKGAIKAGSASGSANASDQPKRVYWHRELPPLDAEAIGEHTLESTSSRICGVLSHRDELWDQCYDDLMAQTEVRLAQEISRLGGDYAHILDESIDSRHDDAKGEAWLHGRFTYVLYRAPPDRSRDRLPGALNQASSDSR